MHHFVHYIRYLFNQAFCCCWVFFCNKKSTNGLLNKLKYMFRGRGRWGGEGAIKENSNFLH